MTKTEIYCKANKKKLTVKPKMAAALVKAGVAEYVTKVKGEYETKVMTAKLPGKTRGRPPKAKGEAATDEKSV